MSADSATVQRHKSMRDEVAYTFSRRVGHAGPISIKNKFSSDNLGRRFMLRQYRFMFFSAIVGLVTLLAFLAVTNVTPGIAQTAGTPAATSATAEGDPARGKYLVQIAGCDQCHGTPSLAVNGVVPLAGGREFKAGQLG